MFLKRDLKRDTHKMSTLLAWPGLKVLPSYSTGAKAVPAMHRWVDSVTYMLQEQSGEDLHNKSRG